MNMSIRTGKNDISGKPYFVIDFDRASDRDAVVRLVKGAAAACCGPCGRALAEILARKIAGSVGAAAAMAFVDPEEMAGLAALLVEIADVLSDAVATDEDWHRKYLDAMRETPSFAPDPADEETLAAIEEAEAAKAAMDAWERELESGVESELDDHGNPIAEESQIFDPDYVPSEAVGKMIESYLEDFEAEGGNESLNDT